MGMGMRVLLGHVDARLPQAYRDLALAVTASGLAAQAVPR